MSQVLEALKWRYATKKFDASRSISTEKVEVIKEAFNLTATSFGLQPVRLVVLNNKTVQEQLVSVSMDQRQVLEASHLLVFCIEKNIDKAYVERYFDTVKSIRNTPDEILQPYRSYLLDNFETETPAETDLWATKQAYLAMGNLLTICALEEIDACPMEGFDPEGYDEILKLSERNLEAVLVMPIGYRASDDMFADFKKVRKQIEQAVLEL